MLTAFAHLLVSFSVAAAPTPYQTIQADLSKISETYPLTARLFELGVSDAGLPIQGLKIGEGAVADLIVATHHGNEYGSTAVAMAAAEEFARNPILDRTVYIIPVLNISGYNSRNRYERIPGGNVDPNRDYPGPCVMGRSFQSKATKALADFIAEKNIVSSATLHTYWPAVLYPWGFSTRDITTPYETLFINLSRAATVESRYEIGNSKELLYAADGAFEDYAFWKHGVWSLLFELGSSHYPSQSEIKRMISTNVPGLRRFIEMAPRQRADNHAFTGNCDYSRSQQRTHLE